VLLIPGGVDSEFLQYLLRNASTPGGRLPSLSEISAETGVSVGKLREQLQVARMLGLVEISPRRGIRLLPYSFLPAVRLSLMIALSLDRDVFYQYSVLRIHLETAFWNEAVNLLTEADKSYLMELVESAQFKLGQRSAAAVPARSAAKSGAAGRSAGPVERIQIPHPEHRAFHLTIYSRLHNPFVLSLLAAYWDAYEAVEFSTYADYGYLQEVWSYHGRIAEALSQGENALGKELLMAHMALIDRLGITHEFPNGGTTPRTAESRAIGENAGPLQNTTTLAVSELAG
jgi:DNA-binding FadR family transcriptional regulator